MSEAKAHFTALACFVICLGLTVVGVEAAAKPARTLRPKLTKSFLKATQAKSRLTRTKDR